MTQELKINDLSVDCEIILKVYQHFGPRGISKLDGDFAFVLYDSNNGLIITGRDQVGLKPLFVGTDDYKNIIGMCSEIKVLERLEGVTKVFKHPIGEAHVLQNLKVTHKHILIDYDLINKETYNVDIEKAMFGIRNYLTKAVNKRIFHNNVPYALLCSGGIDSSLILAICAKYLNIQNIHVFTMKFENDNSFDSTYASMLTQSLGIKNHTIVSFTKDEGISIIEEVIEKLETYDPNTIRASIPMYLLAKYIRQNTIFKVILSGEGADELFMGYNYFGIMNPSSDEAKYESIRLVKNLHSFDILRAERCFSAHGLELRVPFLDKDMVNFVLRLPGWMRLPNKGVEKWIMREAFRELNIPDRIMDRQKERFSDGVGYSWVPTIINFTAGNKNNESLTTEERTKREKEYYRKIYDRLFKNDLIIKRIMPSWAQKSSQNVMAY